MKLLKVNKAQAEAHLKEFLKQAPSGENSARIVAAETRLLEIMEAQGKTPGRPER